MPSDAPEFENWNVLLSLLPRDWQQSAVLLGAVERLRGFDSIGDVLRILLMHVGKGYSLEETAVRPRGSPKTGQSGSPQNRPVESVI